jgi:hypothetical protein
MDMNQAAVFLGGSILIMLGFVVVIAGTVLINNIIHRYWKPVKIFHPDSWRAFNPPPETNTETKK